MYGVIQGFYQCNQQRTQVLNERIYERNQATQPIEMVFDPRPVRTRQVLFPMVDGYTPSDVPIRETAVYHPEQTFLPASNAPFTGYQNSIDRESQLQNRFFPLQKADQSKYIPSSKSDLYTLSEMAPRHIQDYELTSDPHQSLYEPAEQHARETWGHPHPNPFKEVGGDLFYNHTKVQVKNIVVNPNDR